MLIIINNYQVINNIGCMETYKFNEICKEPYVVRNCTYFKVVDTNDQEVCVLEPIEVYGKGTVLLRAWWERKYLDPPYNRCRKE